MDLNALRTFVEVARTRHFGHAADNLFISQSAVSVRIKVLESSLGKTLIVRDRGNIHLSTDGEALLPYAESIVTNWNLARRQVAMPAGVSNTVMVAGVSGLWDSLLQQWLARVMQKEGNVAMVAEIHSAVRIVEDIQNGALDIGFVYDAPLIQNQVCEEFATINLRLVSSIKGCDLDTALGSGYIGVNWGPQFAVEHAQHFPDLVIPKLQTSMGRIALDYLNNHRGSAYLAEPAVRKRIKAGTLHYVKNAPGFTRTAHAIYNPANDRRSLVETLLQYRG